MYIKIVYAVILVLDNFHLSGKLNAIFLRVVPDTDLAGYPAIHFAGYRISG